MKKLLLAGFLLTSNFLLAQKGQKISINNSLMALSVEANSITSTIKSEGDSKFYTVKKDSYGLGVKLGQGTGFSAGANLEFHLTKNSRKVNYTVGAHYIQHGGSVFISQGKDPNQFFWNWATRLKDSAANLQITSIKVPLTLNFNILTLGARKNFIIGLYYGIDGFFNLNTKLKPYDGGLGTSIAKERDASDAVKKFYYSMAVGAKVRYGRLYVHYNVSIINPTDIWTDDYGTDTDTKESFQTLGVGFYLKK